MESSVFSIKESFSSVDVVVCLCSLEKRTKPNPKTRTPINIISNLFTLLLSKEDKHYVKGIQRGIYLVTDICAESSAPGADTVILLSVALTDTSYPVLYAAPTSLQTESAGSSEPS